MPCISLILLLFYIYLILLCFYSKPLPIHMGQQQAHKEVAGFVEAAELVGDGGQAQLVAAFGGQQLAQASLLFPLVGIVFRQVAHIGAGENHHGPGLVVVGGGSSAAVPAAAPHPVRRTADGDGCSRGSRSPHTAGGR